MFKKIEKLMQAKRCTRRELSEATGVPQSTFNSWKHGENKPSFKWLVPIARYFGVDVEYFYDESERGKDADVK